MEKNEINSEDKVSINNFKSNIGKLVRKISVNENTLEPKPFKSGNKFNTVKDVIVHPILDVPAYTFEEDESYVECRRCIVL